AIGSGNKAKRLSLIQLWPVQHSNHPAVALVLIAKLVAIAEGETRPRRNIRQRVVNNWGRRDRIVRVNKWNILRINTVNDLGEFSTVRCQGQVLHAIEKRNRFTHVAAANSRALARIRPEQLVVIEEVARHLLIDHVVEVERVGGKHLEVLLV